MFRACVGNLASARHILDEAARDEFTLLRQDQASALWLAWAADVAHRTRAVDHATTLYRILLPYDDQLAGNGGYLVGSMHHWLGVLAETTGDTAAADDHFAAAIEVHAALGMTYWSLASRAARAAARLGAATEAHHAGAREELLDVRAAAETGGYGRIVADIDAVLAGPPRQLTVGDTSAALQP
jgi:hypothetical protein